MVTTDRSIQKDAATRFFLNIYVLFRSRWETHAEEVSTRGRARSRRPDPIDLKTEAKNVRFREKSQKRESRTARRAASAGRLNDRFKSLIFFNITKFIIRLMKNRIRIRTSANLIQVTVFAENAILTRSAI